MSKPIEFPKWIYHKDGSSKIIESASDMPKDKGWSNEPAKVKETPKKD